MLGAAMHPTFVTAPSAAIPIWFVTRESWPDIRSRLDAPARAFAEAAGFEPKAGRALSLPEWLASEYGDARLRTLGASSLLLAYVFYIVTQFQAFGGIVSHMLDIPSWVASLLVYLFVLYTTFGGLASVASSDEMNLALILIGVTVPAAYMLGRLGNPIELH